MSEPEKCDYCDDTATNPTDIDEIMRKLRSYPGAWSIIEQACVALGRLKAERDKAVADCGHWAKDYNDQQQKLLAAFARAEAAENEIEELREREWLRENRQLRAEIERLKAERDAAEAKADASIWAELRAHDEYSKWKDRAEAAEKEVERLKAMIDGAFT